MKLFLSVQKCFHSLGIDPPQPNHYGFTWKNVLVVFIFAQTCVLDISFFVLKAKTVREFGDSFYTSLTLFTNTIYCLVFIINMRKIKKLIDNLEDFVQKRSRNLDIRETYSELNETIEKVTNIVTFSFMKLTFPAIIFPFAIMSTVMYTLSDSDTKGEALRLPFPMMMPVDMNEPLGYALGVLVETAACYSLCLLESSNMSLLICSCWMFVVIPKDIATELSHLNRDITPDGRRKIFCEIVELYANAKHFVGEFSAIYQFVITAIFLWTLSTICSSLLVLQAEISKGLIELIPPLCLGLWSFAAISFICEVGERVTTSFEEFDLELRNCNWYEFPIDLQRMLIPVMIYTQQPVNIQGYGNTLCTRFALNATVKGGFSYFMMLRQVAN